MLKQFILPVALISASAGAVDSAPFFVQSGGRLCDPHNACQRYTATAGVATVDLENHTDAGGNYVAGALEVTYTIDGIPGQTFQDTVTVIDHSTADAPQFEYFVQSGSTAVPGAASASALTPSNVQLNYVVLDGRAFRQNGWTVYPDLLIGPPPASQVPTLTKQPSTTVPPAHGSVIKGHFLWQSAGFFFDLSQGHSGLTAR